MTDTLPTYPEYKDSGVPWLSDIPAHWEMPRLGALLYERNETNEYGNENQVLSVMKDIGVIRYEDKGNVGNKKSEDTTRYKLVRPDDIVVNSMNVIIGSVGLSKYSGCLSPVYYVLKCRAKDYDNPKFINYIFQDRSFQLNLVGLGNGILAHRMRIPMELLKREFLPRPTPDEQAAIVRFLDAADQRIRRYIRAKQRLIGLLNEQKQAIIQQAVTRGLDADVPLKPSGVERLGDIPAHWGNTVLKRLVTAVGGMTPSKSEPTFWVGEIPWVSPKDMKQDEITDSQDHISNAALQQTGIALIPSPVVLIVVRGMILARRIPVAVTRRAVTINQDMKALRPNAALHPVFLRLLFVGMSPTLLGEMEVAGHGTLCFRTEHWANLPVALPPVSEQIKIIEFINSQANNLDQTISITKREIETIREYRTRLIADVVTGKIDVRAAAFDLPEPFADKSAFLAELDALPDDDPDAIDPSDALATSEDNTDDH